MVVLVILMILFALSLPAIQAVREQARAIQCRDNLKKIVLGLQNYHDTFRTFPAGAMHAGRTGESERMGPSWWYGALPFIGERNMYDRINSTQRAGFPVAGVPFNAQAINGIMDPPQYQNLLATFNPPIMRCPSSPLPVMEQPTGPIALPTYVGISGGCDISQVSNDYAAAEKFPDWQAPSSSRQYVNRFKGTAPHNGIMTSSGMMPPSKFQSMASCSDGTSNTIIVGEQSDWLRDTDPDNPAKFHGDAGWDTNGTAGTGPKDGGGFLSGMSSWTVIPRVEPPDTSPAPWDVECYNLTTVRYRPTWRVIGTHPYPGCSEDHGVNNPLQSAHPGGTSVAFVDGSVVWLSENIDLAVMLRVAIRDDGQNVKVPKTPLPGTPTDVPIAVRPPVVSAPSPLPKTPTDVPIAVRPPVVSPPNPMPDNRSAEGAALAFVRACFVDRNVEEAVALFDAGAVRNDQGRGSAVEAVRRMIPKMPPPEVLRLSEIHLFRKNDLETLSGRFRPFNFDRIEARIGDGLGCLLGFTVKTSSGTERRVYLAHVLQNQSGQFKIVLQDDGRELARQGALAQPESPVFVAFGHKQGEGEQAKMVADRVIVNLRDPSKVVHLNVVIMLQTDSGNQQVVAKAVDSKHRMLKNWLTAYLSDKTLDDVRGTAAINRMRREIKDEFNRLLFDDGVERIRDVHFEEFIVQ